MLQHPFYDRTAPVILGDHVTLDAGTGDLDVWDLPMKSNANSSAATGTRGSWPWPPRPISSFSLAVDSFGSRT